VLVALTKLGATTAFIGKVGQDEFGHYLKSTLNECGIDTSGITITNQVNTTVAFVHLDEQGDRSFSFYRNPGADMMLETNEIPYSMIEQSKVFHCGSISMTNEPAATSTIKALEFAKSIGLLISFDPNLRTALWEDLEHAKFMIQQGLFYANVLKISEEELIFLTGTSDPEKGSYEIDQNYGVSLILITLGAEGCFYRLGDRSGKIPGYRVNTIDTTGAGDAFLGGMLFQLLTRIDQLHELTNDELRSMILFANAVGALVTTKKGTIHAMPNLTEIN